MYRGYGERNNRFPLTPTPHVSPECKKEPGRYARFKSQSSELRRDWCAGAASGRPVMLSRTWTRGPSNRLSAAVGDLDAVLELSAGVHEAPFVFPLFALLVESNLPRLVKSLKPEILRSVLERLADPVLHEAVHLVDAGHGALLASLGLATVLAPCAGPPCLGNDVFALV